MSEQKKLDRPKLRKLIIEALPCPKQYDNLGGELCPPGVSYCKDCPFAISQAQPALALIPDIEEAKKQERERIMGVLRASDTPLDIKTEQALKGGGE